MKIPELEPYIGKLVTAYSKGGHRTGRLSLTKREEIDTVEITTKGITDRIPAGEVEKINLVTD